MLHLCIVGCLAGSVMYYALAGTTSASMALVTYVVAYGTGNCGMYIYHMYFIK